jgi:hypothetical protein
MSAFQRVRPALRDQHFSPALRDQRVRPALRDQLFSISAFSQKSAPSATLGSYPLCFNFSFSAFQHFSFFLKIRG